MRIFLLILILFTNICYSKNYYTATYNDDSDSISIIVRAIRIEINDVKIKLKSTSSTKEADIIFDRFSIDLEKLTEELTYDNKDWLSEYAFYLLENDNPDNKIPEKFQNKILLLKNYELTTHKNINKDIEIKPQTKLYKDIFYNYVSEDYKRFIDILNNQANDIYLKDLDNVVLDWELFLNNYKHSNIYQKARSNYLYTLGSFLYGSYDNPKFKTNDYDNEIDYFYDDDIIYFTNFSKKYRHTNTGKILNKLLKYYEGHTFAETNDYVFSEINKLYPLVAFPEAGFNLSDFEKYPYKIQMKAEGDLNNDEINDAVLVMRNVIDSTDIRPILILIKNPANDYELLEVGFNAISPEYYVQNHQSHKTYDYENISVYSGLLNTTFHSLESSKNIESIYRLENNSELILDKISTVHIKDGEKVQMDYNIESGQIEFNIMHNILKSSIPITFYRNYKYPTKITINNSDPEMIMGYLYGMNRIDYNDEETKQKSITNKENR